MRIFVIGAAAMALGACSQAEPAAEATSDTAPAEMPAASSTVANGSPAGAYQVAYANGQVMTANINADGTYSDVDADGKVTEEGTWAVKDGKTCFTPTTEGAKGMCFTETPPAADGSFTATPDEGDPVTVKPQPRETTAM